MIYNTREMTKPYDVLILGGGIAGLYAAYKIHQRSPQFSILILEKENYLGGRVYTHRDKTMEVEAGAGRLSDKHIRVLELIQDLGLKRKLSRLTAETLFIEHGTGKRLNSVFDVPENMSDDSELINSILMDRSQQLLLNDKQPIVPIVLDAILGENTQPAASLVLKILVASKTADADALRNQTFLEYASSVLSPEEVAFLEKSFGYYTELVVMNAYDACLLMDALSPLNAFYGIKGGFDQIIHRLEDKLRNLAGGRIRILKNKTVEDIQYGPAKRDQARNTLRQRGGMFWNNKTQKLHKRGDATGRGMIHRVVCSDGSTYSAYRCVCALPKNAMEKFRVFRPIRSLLNKIVCGALCRIYAKYEPDKETGKMWFADLPKSTTDSNLRIIIPIDVKQGIIMVSYTDNKFAEYWRKIYETKGEEGVEKEIAKLMEETVGRPIPPAVRTNVFYWKCGVGYWGVGANSQKIAQRLVQPFPQQDLYICGENYSATNQQWMEGALETAEHVVERMFPEHSAWFW